MKKKIILGIILGLILIGAGVYFFNKKPKENIQVFEENVVKNNGEKIECNSAGESLIKVLSPNGGENFYVLKSTGIENIIIKWQACNLKTKVVGVGLVNVATGKVNFSMQVPSYFDGENQSEFSIFPDNVGNYKLILCDTTEDPNSYLSVDYINSCNIYDESDMAFNVSVVD